MVSNNEIIHAAEEIIGVLEFLIPEDAQAVGNELKQLIQQAKIGEDQDEAVNKIIAILEKHDTTKGWLLDWLASDATQHQSRSNVEAIPAMVAAPEMSMPEPVIMAEPVFMEMEMDIEVAPAMDMLLEEDEDAPHIYPVWFGTNREPVNSADLSKGFSGRRSSGSKVFYGKCDVEIPKTHRFGETGRAWWRRWLALDFSGDDHLKVEKIHGADSAESFWADLSQTFANSDSGKDALVFLHGFNNSFEDAAIRAAQIGFDLKIKGQTAFFSWPSKAQTFKYTTDESSIQASEIAITNFLTDFAEKSGADRIHLMAHSMGNRGLLRALQNITYRVSSGSKNIQFGHIILAAPDLDVEVFRHAKEAYTSLSETTTIYTSEKDIPVSLSEWLHTYPRLGIVPPITVESGVDTIQVNNFNLFNLGHGYFAEAEALLQDIFDLIQNGTNADARQRPKKQMTGDGRTYWLIDT